MGEEVSDYIGRLVPALQARVPHGEAWSWLWPDRREVA